MKILSGVLVTKAHQKGSVVISLLDNSIVYDLGDERVLEPSDLIRDRMIEEEGEEGWNFDGEPCVTISLRQIRVQDEDEHTLWAKPPTISSDNFTINHSVTPARLTIHWEAGPVGSLIEEISYLVIGPVAEPPGTY